MSAGGGAGVPDTVGGREWFLKVQWFWWATSENLPAAASRGRPHTLHPSVQYTQYKYTEYTLFHSPVTCCSLTHLSVWYNFSVSVTASVFLRRNSFVSLPLLFSLHLLWAMLTWFTHISIHQSQLSYIELNLHAGRTHLDTQNIYFFFSCCRTTAWRLKVEQTNINTQNKPE